MFKINNKMKFKALSILGTVLLLLSCNGPKEIKVTVTNDSDLSREAETVEILMKDLTAYNPDITADNAVVTDSHGRQLPVQVYTERTSQEKLIFQATIAAGETKIYTISAGHREKFDTLACSRHIPGNENSYVYENNLVAGRIYGPDLKYPRTLGSDIWVKSTDRILMDEWIENDGRNHQHEETIECYESGNTLGGGACAPYVGDKIIIGDNWDTQHIICNGPIRTKAVFTYDDFEVNRKSCRVTRELTLDADSRFLKISTWFNCNVDELPVVLGAVQHDVISRTDGDHYIAITERAPDIDAEIYIGLVIDAAEKNVTSGTMDGHAVLKAVATPGKRFDSWTGSGWSHGSIRSSSQWSQSVKDFAYAQAHPLKVTVGD